MIYIIDKDITFNTENGSLKSITKGREVFLSSVNTRVFKCLLEHSHEAVSRETLLRQVWTDHGLSASSATLNQYICLTRRALASVGFNERLIVTLSKKGYRLNRIIPINRQSVDFLSRLKPPRRPFLPSRSRQKTATIFLFCCAAYRSSCLCPSWCCAPSITSTTATAKESRCCRILAALTVARSTMSAISSGIGRTIISGFWPGTIFMASVAAPVRLSLPRLTVLIMPMKTADASLSPNARRTVRPFCIIVRASTSGHGKS